MLSHAATGVLSMASGDVTNVRIVHRAHGVARVMKSRVRLTESGSTLDVSMVIGFGERWASMSINQLDTPTLRRAVTFLEGVARQALGDPAPTAMPISPRTYLPASVWRDTTAAAFTEARHAVMPTLLRPLVDAGINASAFVGVSAASYALATRQGIHASGQETDAELVVTGWTPDGKGAGWAGATHREWTQLDPTAVSVKAIERTRRAAAPVAIEPGRRTVILDRPAVAQLVYSMGPCFDASRTLGGATPLFNRATGRSKMGERVLDTRLTISADPNDPEGGYLPFDLWTGFPLIPMTYVERGVLTNLAYEARFAAEQGVTPSNLAPWAIRVMGQVASEAPTTTEAMIASCADGIYVTRLAGLRCTDFPSQSYTGVTNGGTYLVRDGRIVKAIKNLRFLESPWLCLNRVLAVGTSARTAFGYAPWHGEWPLPPVIVPPLMIRDFNFTALADNV